MTEEHRPMPAPAASATGSVKAGTTAQAPIGVMRPAATSIAAASPSMPVSPRQTRNTMSLHDVGREQRGVREREQHAERLADELDAGDQVDACNRGQKR